MDIVLLKQTIGTVTVVLSVVGFFPYIKDTLKGKTKPHLFSWFIWSIVLVIVFIGQIAKGAGAGAWATGTSAILAIFIFLLAFKKKGIVITIADILSLVLALLAIIFWYFSKNPTIAIVIVTLVDALALIPTFRKMLINPDSETKSLYTLNIIRQGLTIAAMGNYNVTTLFYPVYSILSNTGILMVPILKRKKNL